MASERTLHILTINSGSSSVKFALYAMGEREPLLFAGSMERIGLPAGSFQAQDADGANLVDECRDLPDHATALSRLFSWLRQAAPDREIDAVGHRIVQGGVAHRQPQVLTPELIATLRTLIPLAPDHLPHELQAIRAVCRLNPALPQVACFDTAFHRRMPTVAQTYALPRIFRQQGVIRFGFHGLSYEYIMCELRTLAGADVANGHIVIAHLGNGASMAAVHHGKSIETTMGFTPMGGLVMSTRPGDLDPGVVLYLLQEQGMSPAVVNHLLNQQSGLLGVSGVSSDMKDLLDKARDNPQAAEAIDLFCYHAKKYLGALTAALGGIDTLIFTGGIGEQAPEIRRRICEGLAFLGIEVDAERNAANAPIISSPSGPVTTRVMKTDEELMIARHTYRLVAKTQRGQQAA